MGRSVPVMAAGARNASQMASRSYVFGRDDSNSAAAPTDGSSAQVPPPPMLLVSFALATLQYSHKAGNGLPTLML